MQDRVTVRTDWPQVFDRINDIRAVDLRQRAEVMDVDETFGHVPVHVTEAEPADATSRAVCVDALTARVRVALVSIHRDRTHCPLNQTARLNNLLSQDGIRYGVAARPRQVSPQRLFKRSKVDRAFAGEGDPTSDDGCWNWSVQQDQAAPQIEPWEDAPTFRALLDRADRRVADDAKVFIATVDNCTF